MIEGERVHHPKNASAAPTAITAVEQHGIESIPDSDRDSSIFAFVRLCWGGANSLATAVLGAFPIMFGLPFWQAITAAALGLLIGSSFGSTHRFNPARVSRVRE